MAEWAGIVNTTITKYIRGEVDETMRNRKLLAIMKERGLVSFNNSGVNVQWQPRYLQNQLLGFDDSDTLTFSRVNRHKDAVLPWRGYRMSEQMTDRERKMNNGQEAIVKLFSNKAKWMAEDITARLGAELYIDGNASGNEQRWHGIESFGGVSGTVSSSKVGAPSDTYAGLSTVLGTYGGAATGIWPDGTADTQYDFWSPLIVDYTNVLWPQSTKTWENTCIDALRYGLIAGRRNDDESKQVDLVTLNREMYRQWITLVATEERINISPSEGSSGLYKLGFKDMQNFDGTDITWEYNTPAGLGYGWCLSDIELMCLDSELVDVQGPVFDESSQAWRFWSVLLSNLKFESIRNFIFWKAVS